MNEERNVQHGEGEFIASVYCRSAGITGACPERPADEQGQWICAPADEYGRLMRPVRFQVSRLAAELDDCVEAFSACYNALFNDPAAYPSFLEPELARLYTGGTTTGRAVVMEAGGHCFGLCRPNAVPSFEQVQAFETFARERVKLRADDLATIVAEFACPMPVARVIQLVAANGAAADFAWPLIDILAAGARAETVQP